MVVICMKFYEMAYRVRRDYVWGGMQYKVAGTKVKNYSQNNLQSGRLGSGFYLPDKVPQKKQKTMNDAKDTTELSICALLHASVVQLEKMYVHTI